MNAESLFKLRYIYLLSFACCLYLIYLFGVDISFDSPSYINAWSTLQEGHIDIWRTPIYPLFLGLMQTTFGDNYLYCAVIVQHLVFLVSIRYFYQLINCVILNSKISFFITLFYAFYPCASTYNCCIATETFAVTGVVFLMYSIFKLYSTRKPRFGIYSFIWLFFLIFLRPAVVYFLPVTIVGWLIAAFKERKLLNSPSVVGMVGSVAVTVLLVIYMAMFKVSYSVFTPSGIGLMNKYAIAKAAGIIEYNSKGNDKLQFYQEVEDGVREMGMNAFSDYVNQSISRNKGRYIMRLFQNVRNASEDNLFEPSYSNGILGVISNLMGIKIKILYLLFLAYSLLLLRWMIKRNEFAFFSSMLLMIGVSNFVLIIIASPGEYGRLSLPAVPIYLIMFGQLFNCFKAKRLFDIQFT